MTATPQSLARLWEGFIGNVAEGLAQISSLVRKRRRLSITEVGKNRFSVASADPQVGVLGTMTYESDGRWVGDSSVLFAAIKGAHVTVTTLCDRFMERELVLPAQAREFVPNILRTEVDRLTPWSSSDAVYGYFEKGISDQKLKLGIVAADGRPLRQMFTSLEAFRPASIQAAVRRQEEDTDIDVPIYRNREATSERQTLRAALSLAPLLLAICLGLSSIYQVWAGSQADAAYDAAQGEIARQRKFGRAEAPSIALEKMLLRRKVEGPVSVLLLNELSRLLPDDTYLTEFELSGKKIRITGLSTDATGLIRLLEGSGIYSDVSFIAPTTRDATEPGDKFHIEASFDPKKRR